MKNGNENITTEKRNQLVLRWSETTTDICDTVLRTMRLHGNSSNLRMSRHNSRTAFLKVCSVDPWGSAKPLWRFRGNFGNN